MLEQISIFAENTKGAMQKMTQILQDENINILGSVTHDGAEYGTVRMIVSDTDKAYNAFRNAGYLCCKTEVLGILIEDKVGEMNKLLLAIAETNVSVDYVYLTFDRESAKPVLIIRVNDIMEVEESLINKGFRSLGN